MTELLDQPTEVRMRVGGEIEAVLLPEGWRMVARTNNDC